MAVDIRVNVTGALNRLSIINQRVQARVLDALDEGAALVANHAKQGHPKVHDDLQGTAARGFRVVTGPEAGDFSGWYRFLTRTGVLRNSIQQRKAKKIGQDFQAEVFSGVEYADRIEFGSVRHQAYPFLRPALESQRGGILQRVQAAVRRGVEGP